MTNPITIIRPDRIERYEVVRDTRIGDCPRGRGTTARGVSGDGPELMLGDEMCFQASETPAKEKGR